MSIARDRSGSKSDVLDGNIIRDRSGSKAGEVDDEFRTTTKRAAGFLLLLWNFAGKKRSSLGKNFCITYPENWY